MRVARRASSAAKGEVDADAVADGGETLEDHAGALRTELGFVIGGLVDARLWGGGVEVKRVPGCGEGVIGIRVCGLVEGDGFFELVVAHVALEWDWSDVLMQSWEFGE